MDLLIRLTTSGKKIHGEWDILLSGECMATSKGGISWHVQTDRPMKIGTVAMQFYI